MSCGVVNRRGLELVAFSLEFLDSSMTLTSCGSLAGCEYHAPYRYKKILDGDSPLWHISGMAKHIVKVDRTNRTFRIVIPQTIIQRWRWGNADYVIIDDTNDDYLILRRLIYGEAGPTENKRYSPG